REEGAKAGLDPILEGLKGLSLIKARTEEETATAAALLLRETLETEGRTAALVTPDQGLARRVSAKLSRWGIEADSSAGSPLSGSPVGIDCPDRPVGHGQGRSGSALGAAQNALCQAGSRD
ncbi:MAG: hypothetical protein RLZZ141_971, partial [Pseudomonadota bacterium]